MSVSASRTPSGTADRFGGRASFVVTIPAGVRASLRGVSVAWWAVGIKLPAGQLFGSACAKQRF